MSRHTSLLTSAIVAALALSPSAAVIPPETLPRGLVAMANAERAFAKRAAETNWRDAFLEFFADSAVSFQGNEPGNARERLKKLPMPEPGFELIWEPRVGDIAASGDLGWLTGPALRKLPGKPESHGCYFSIWKKQPDGSFKVIIDVGADSPVKVPFAPGFVRSGAIAKGKPVANAEAPEQSLMAADRALSEALRTKGAAAAFADVMHDQARLHRTGVVPLTTKRSATGWLAERVTSMTSVPEKSETSAAGDLGYTWGKATVTTDGKERTGYYVRVWIRTSSDGRWQLAADVTPV